jgi:membrane fusion protein (multidrug efflux system)
VTISRKKYLISLISLLVIIIAVATVLYMKGHQKPAAAVQDRPTQVVTTPVTLKKIPNVINVLGSLVAPQTLDIKAQQAGTVKALHLKEGERVKQGQLLIELDDIKQQAALHQAQADYWQKKAQFDRYQHIYQEDKSLVSKSQYDQTVSSFKQSQAALATAQQNLAETRIYAPFSGTLTVSQLTLGSYVNQGQSLITLVNRANLEAVYQLPETDLRYLKSGQSISLTTDTYPNRQFHGIIRYISPIVDQQSLSVTVRAKVDNSQDQLSPGMLTHIKQQLKRPKPVLAVPSLSLVPVANGYTVYLIDKNKVVSQAVTVGHRFAGWVEILSGLKAGQQVISSNTDKIGPGSPVKATTSTSQA